MNTKRRNKEVTSRTPFPKLPIPSKFQRIPQNAPIELVQPSQPVQVMESPKTIQPKPKTKKRLPVGSIDVAEPIVGGVLEPEPLKRHDAGDHVVEDLDYSDYK